MARFEGAFTAMVTPFTENGVNETRLREMVDFQIANGISGLVPCGTTGESPTLSHEEHHRVIDIVIETANNRVPIIAGTGSNSTSEAVSLTNHAKEAGADAALLITPYYNKPSQSGIISHYTKIAEECDLPLIIYNCPGRTAINTTADTIVELSALPNIVGVKEASGSMSQIADIIARTPDDFIVLSGDDGITVPLMSIGGAGVISVVSNIVPQKMSDMTSAALSGDFSSARKIHTELFTLMKTLMSIETNPSPVKAAMNLIGMDMGPVRPPLAYPNESGLADLRDILSGLNLL